MNLIVKVFKQLHPNIKDFVINNNVVIVKDKTFMEIANNTQFQSKMKELQWQELQQKQTNKLYQAYETANELDIAYLNSTFQADKKSQDLIVSVLSAGSVPTGFFWLDKANNQVAMTYAELQGLSGAILTRNQANFIKFQGLKTQANAATTQAALDKIVW